MTIRGRVLLTGARVLGVAAGACLISAVSFYIWLAIAIGGRRTISPDLWAGILYATIAAGSAATVSAFTPKHRLTRLLLALDGVLLLSSGAIAYVDTALEPQRHQAENLAYQERITREFSTGHLTCADGYEVHRLNQGHLALVYFQVGNRDLPVQFLATKASQTNGCELYQNEFLLDTEENRLATCINEGGETVEDWLEILTLTACSEVSERPVRGDFERQAAAWANH